MKRTYECECSKADIIDFDKDEAFCPVCNGYVQLKKLAEMNKIEIIEKYVLLWSAFETMLHNENTTENLYCTDNAKQAEKIDCFKLHHTFLKEHNTFHKENQHILQGRSR